VGDVVGPLGLTTIETLLPLLRLEHEVDFCIANGENAVDSGAGCIEPSAANVDNGSYKPLARPLFIYPSKKALARPEFVAFLNYYLENVNTFVDETGYIEALPAVLAKSKADLAAALP